MRNTISLSLALCLLVSTVASACGPGEFNGGLARGGGFKGDFARYGGFNPNQFAVQRYGAQQQMMAAARQQFALQAAARRARMKPIRMAKAMQMRQDVLAKREVLRTELLAKREARQRAEAEFLASARTWIDSTGKHNVTAQFVMYENGAVKLKRSDGKVITVPMKKLSLGDIAWVQVESNLPSPHGAGPSLLAAR